MTLIKYETTGKNGVSALDKFPDHFLDEFKVYTQGSGENIISGRSDVVHLSFRGEFIMAPSIFPFEAQCRSSENADHLSTASSLSSKKGIACQNLTFYRHKDSEVVELANWGDGGLALIYLISLMKQELEAFNRLLGEQSGHHVEIWVPLPALYSLTNEQYQWLNLLLEPNSHAHQVMVRTQDGTAASPAFHQIQDELKSALGL